VKDMSIRLGYLFKESGMRLFAIVLAFLGLFVYLLATFSFWAAFGGMYMVGMIAVALIAGFGRHQASSKLSWEETSEVEQGN